MILKNESVVLFSHRTQFIKISMKKKVMISS